MRNKYKYNPPLLPALTREKLRPERKDFAPERPHRHTRFYTKQEANLEYRPSRDIPIPIHGVQLPESSSEHNVCLFRDPLDQLVKVTESQGEQNTILLFCQDPKVSRIETQFEYLKYIDSDGVQRSTAYDARVSYYDGFRTLVSSKPKVRAEKTGHFELNDLILDQVPSDIADQAQTITERDMSQWSLANSRLFQSVLNDRFWVCLEELREHARDLRSPVTISDFCEPFGGTGVCFRTVIKLLFERELVLVDAGEIDIGSKVKARPTEVAP